MHTDFYHYDPAEGHGLPHDPFKAIVCPRPIGWISSRGTDGAANLAPYSFFNAVCDEPPAVAFASDGWKNTVSNIRETGAFAFNLVTEALAEKMNLTSILHERGIDEFDAADIERRDCRRIPVPCVAESPAVLECRLMHLLELRTWDDHSTEFKLVVGQVVGISINRRFLQEGRFEIGSVRPILRAGYRGDYVQVTAEAMFTMTRPPNSY
jgi:flavin reductase (DIM6/NTAB) family NADH-FMN oxidoreductase RutF